MNAPVASHTTRRVGEQTRDGDPLGRFPAVTADGPGNRPARPSEPHPAGSERTRPCRALDGGAVRRLENSVVLVAMVTVGSVTARSVQKFL